MGTGPVFTIQNPLAFQNLGEILQVLLTLAFFVAGIAFLIMFVLGGLRWITAGGDPKTLDAARSQITNAAIGLILVVAAYAIAAIAEQVFGISIVGGFNFR